MRILFLLLFYPCLDTYGQQLKRFYDNNHIEVTPDKAGLYSVLDFKDSVWVENSYYLPAMKFHMYGRYRDSSCKIPVDSFYYFHWDGSLAMVGNYVDGKKEGLWLSYHTNGMMSDSTSYVKGQPVGVSLSWFEDGSLVDSTNWVHGSGGNIIAWTNEGHLNMVGHYNNEEKKNGEWRFYYTNGKLSSLEVYELDSLKSIQTFDENGNVIPNDGVRTKVEIESEYPNGIKGWQKFLVKTIHFPADAVEESIQGTVLVQFIVDKEGEVSDIKVLSGPQEGGLREEAIRVIKKSGKWVPAISHGRKVKSYKRQPISFRFG